MERVLFHEISLSIHTINNRVFWYEKVKSFKLWKDLISLGYGGLIFLKKFKKAKNKMFHVIER